MAQAPLPRPAGNASWGRALAREHLDTWILEQALRAGAEIRQPATAEEILPDSGNYQCRLKTESSQEEVVRAKLIIAGHGSWDPGHLPTQRARLDSLPSDLLAFKAHFTNSDLAPGLMPLLAFPGGYGGMVHVDESRVSLSCCLRRDILALDRQRHPGPAGEAVLGHIQEHCRGVRLALHSARREGEWLSAGPIRPGIRLRFPGGIFPVGNLAGEAHPVIAEGISMALQSSWLLCQRLIAWRTQGAQRAELPGLGSAYAGDWRRYFSPRLQASRLLAEWAMRPALVSAAIPLVWSCPALLTWVARVTGKAHGVIKSSGFPALGSYS